MASKVSWPQKAEIPSCSFLGKVRLTLGFCIYRLIFAKQTSLAKNMELRPNSYGQNLNSNKNRNLAFGSSAVSEILLLSSPWSAEAFESRLNSKETDWLSHKQGGSCVTLRQQQLLKVSLAPFESDDQLSLLAGTVLLLEFV